MENMELICQETLNTSGVMTIWVHLQTHVTPTIEDLTSFLNQKRVRYEILRIL